MAKPIVAVTIGDPAGIGPEVVAKALAEQLRQGQNSYIPVVIGPEAVVKKTFNDLSIKANVRKISDVSEALELGPSEQNGVLVLEVSPVDPADLRMGHTSALAGKISWEDGKKSTELIKAGKVQATVSAPGDSGSSQMAAAAGLIPKPTGEQGIPTQYGLTLVCENLRVVHLSHHLPLTEACAFVTKDNVLAKLKMTDDFLKGLGLPRRLIALAGLNPHAHGKEDERELIPAAQAAKEMGLNVEGPISPDTVFLRAAAGEFDAVLALFHDQGHIATKTYGFNKGIVSITLGMPYLSLSVGHGSAYDIAGKGIANPSAISQAIAMAGKMAASHV